MNMFRTLRADEIDCRISQIKETTEGAPSGLTLLLYKDARCDQNILDEVVGPFKWKREHTRDNRNCIVSIWSDELGQWIAKEDTGTESNTEKEKGLASDSFKRACFNWGIGRELYTAPFVWIKAKDCDIRKNKYGKLSCYDNFTVTDIDYIDGNICFLTIKNEKTGKECFRWGEKGKLEGRSVQPDNEPDADPISDRRDSPADVKKVNSVPELPVCDYIRSEIEEIQKKLKLESYQETKKLVLAWGDALAKSGAIPPINWVRCSMDEAVNAFQAMNETFKPGVKK